MTPVKDDVAREGAFGQAPALTEWAAEPSVEDLKNDLQLAEPSHQKHVAKVKHWLAIREAATRKDKARPNRSSIQPKLIRRQNEWRYSALTEPFLASPKLFDVSPATWAHGDSARKNELVLNWQMRTKLNKVKFIDDYVRTAVDEGTVIVRPNWRRETRIEKVMVPVWSYYPIDDPEQAQMYEEAVALEESNPQGFSELPEDLQAAVEYGQEVGIPVYAVQVGEEEIEEEVVVRNHPTLEILDFENVYIDPSCNGDIDKANFAVISFETSKAELLKDGRYKNLDKINWSGHAPLHTPEHATHDTSHIQFKDDLRKRVVAYEYWGFYDVEGKGELTPIVATWIGSTMIRMERNPYPDQAIPLVVAQYMPLRKSVTGEPDAELLEDNQAILGALTRGMIDLMGRSANGQTGVAKGMLDVVNRRRFDRGDDYEFNPSLAPAAGLHQHKYPEIPQSALVMLQMQNQDAESLTGVKAFSGGMSGEAFGKVATAIRGMLDAASKREMAILRRLAQGIEQIGRKLIAMNQVFLSDEEWVEVTNEHYQAISREDLAGEFNLVVDISTSEVDEQKATDLGFMLQTLGVSMPFEMTKKILAEIARLKRMPELAHSILTYQPQPDPLEERRKELEIAKLEAEIAEETARAQLAHAKAAEAQAKARALGSDADLKDLNFLEQESGTKHVRDLDKIGEQARANQKLEITKSLLAPSKKGEEKSDVARGMSVSDRSALLT